MTKEEQIQKYIDKCRANILNAGHSIMFLSNCSFVPPNIREDIKKYILANEEKIKYYENKLY